MQQRPTTPPGDLDALAAALVRHALPLSLKWHPEQLPWAKAKRGTLSLVATGQRHLFVTCSHVLAEVEKMHQKNMGAQMVAYMGLNGRVTELTGFGLIDSDERLDVAIFHGLRDRITIPGMEFIDYSSSYLPDPVPGDFISIIGYPGATIAVTRSKGLFGFMHLGLRVSSVSETGIGLADENNGWQFVRYEDPDCRGISRGGLSGSPAFIHRDGRARFVGIVMEDSSHYPIVRVSRLGCINADGTINRNFIPC